MDGTTVTRIAYVRKRYRTAREGREPGQGENRGVCTADMKQAISKCMESIWKGEAQLLIISARKRALKFHHPLCLRPRSIVSFFKNRLNRFVTWPSHFGKRAAELGTEHVFPQHPTLVETTGSSLHFNSSFSYNYLKRKNQMTSSQL